MFIHQTELQKEFAKQPNVLDFNRAVVHREIDLSQDTLSQLRRLETGMAGEQLLVEKLEEFGQTDWTIVRNLRLKNYATFEIDSVLLTRTGAYLFEVKNYTGHFEFNQGNSFFNGMELNSNVVQQTRKAYLHLQEICRKYSKNIQVKGVLVFIGENNQVSIQSDTGDIRVLTLTDLHAFSKEIIEVENSHPFPTFDTKGLLTHLETFETKNNYMPIPLTAAEISRARSGIYCSRCFSYEVKFSKTYVKCACGLHEPRDEARIRTICEFGMLTYDRELIKSEVLKFLGGDASERYLRNILNQYFSPAKKSRYTHYKNLKLPYYLIKDLFDIDKPVIFHNKRGFPEVYLLD